MKDNAFQFFCCPKCDEEYKKEAFVYPFTSFADLKSHEENYTCDKCNCKFKIRIHKVANVEINFIESIIID